MTFEEFLSKKDEMNEESRSLVEKLTQEYSEDYLRLNNKIDSDEALKEIKIKSETLIALLQEKQDILSNLRYDNYEITLKAFEEKEEQIYRQFCILRNAVYSASDEKLKPQKESGEIFDDIKDRQKSKSFMETLNKYKSWMANHYNVALRLSLIIGVFISIAYFFHIDYFPRLDTASVFYYLVIITIIGIIFTFCFCLFFVLLIFLFYIILKKIKRVDGKACGLFIFILLIQILVLIILSTSSYFSFMITNVLCILGIFIFPLLFYMLKRLNIFYLKNNQNKSEIYVLLFVFGLCCLCACFFAIFVPVQTGIITDIDSALKLFIYLLFVFCSVIALLLQEKFNPIKVNFWVFVLTFLYFSFCLTPNVFKIIHLGNYQLESLTLDKQAKGFIDKNCLQQTKQGDDDTIVINDIKVLLNIGEEYRLEMQCNDKKVQFSIPSHFIKGKQEFSKTSD